MSERRRAPASPPARAARSRGVGAALRCGIVLVGALLSAPGHAVAADVAPAADPSREAGAAFREGRIAAAIALWSQAIATASRTGSRSDQAEALARRGEAWRVEGHLTDAAADLADAYCLSTAVGNARVAAASAAALGSVALLGRWSSVAQRLSAEISERLSAAPACAAMLPVRESPPTRKSSEYCGGRLPVRPAPEPEAAAPVPSDILLADARTLLRLGHGMALRIGARDLASASANDLGNLYAGIGCTAAADAAYAEAIDTAEQDGDERRVAAVDANAARLALARRDDARAADRMQDALERLAAQPQDRAAAQAYLDLGVVAAGQDGAPQVDPAEAMDAARAVFGHARLALERAQGIADASAPDDSALHSAILGSLGRLYEQEGDPARAEGLTRRALVLAAEPDLGDHSFRADLSFRWDWQLARVLHALGRDDDEEYFAAYRRAIVKLQAIKQDIPVEYPNGISSFDTTFRPLYTGYIDLLLRRADHPGRGETRASLLGEARARIEELTPLELKDYFRDYCDVDFEVRPPSGGGAVPPGVAIISPIVLSDRIEVLLSVASNDPARKPGAVDVFHFASPPVAERDVQDQVQQFRIGLTDPGLAYRKPAEVLYRWLIQPLRQLLVANRIRTLVFVPDRTFRRVAFAVLGDGQQFLVQQFAIAVEPALGLVVHARRRAPEGRMLVAGLSKGSGAVSPLPAVAGEVRDLASQWGATPLLDSTFTHQSFMEKLGDPIYTSVHIASHAHFYADAGRTLIETANIAIRPEQIGDSIRQSRKDGLDLLFLSACDTASGDDRAILGLAGLSVQAGSRSVIGSLWNVNDQAARVLVWGFYSALAAGASKAEALRQAQLELLQDPLLSHPHEWGAFLLSGDWQ